MLLLEHKIKMFLEDKRSPEKKLLDEFQELKIKDDLLKLAGCLQINRHKKWIHRAKYRIQNNRFLGVSQISWEKIKIGRK